MNPWQCPLCGMVYAGWVPNCHNAHQAPPVASNTANVGQCTCDPSADEIVNSLESKLIARHRRNSGTGL